MEGWGSGRGSAKLSFSQASCTDPKPGSSRVVATCARGSAGGRARRLLPFAPARRANRWRDPTSSGGDGEAVWNRLVQRNAVPVAQVVPHSVAGDCATVSSIGPTRGAASTTSWSCGGCQYVGQCGFLEVPGSSQPRGPHVLDQPVRDLHAHTAPARAAQKLLRCHHRRHIRRLGCREDRTSPARSTSGRSNRKSGRISGAPCAPDSRGS